MISPLRPSGTSLKYDIEISYANKLSPVVFGGGSWELGFIINYDVKYCMGKDDQTSEVSETSEV